MFEWWLRLNKQLFRGFFHIRQKQLQITFTESVFQLILLYLLRRSVNLHFLIIILNHFMGYLWSVFHERVGTTFSCSCFRSDCIVAGPETWRSTSAARQAALVSWIKLYYYILINIHSFISKAVKYIHENYKSLKTRLSLIGAAAHWARETHLIIVLFELLCAYWCVHEAFVVLLMKQLL